jgi:hypothetical protein
MIINLILAGRNNQKNNREDEQTNIIFRTSYIHNRRNGFMQKMHHMHGYGHQQCGYFFSKILQHKFQQSDHIRKCFQDQLWDQNHL